MNDAVHAAARRFPLLGRPRPACPTLPHRIQELTDAVATAAQKAEHGFADAAHALNKAALIASDCRLPYLAEQLCWQHIHAYQNLDRPLTVLEARYLLEPVLNLARLQIRADQGNAAVQLLEAMYHAVTKREDLTVGDQVLPIADLTGGQQERRQLREWVWLQLIGEGVRALALAGRWAAAAEHARSHNGIGLHLMEGRQAAVIAASLNDDLPLARALLAESTPTEPWELEVAACLHLMATLPDAASNERHLDAALARYRARGRLAGYASYRARLGLTIVTLSHRPTTAAILLHEIADEAITSADGYSASDVLKFRDPVNAITARQHTRLTAIATASGLDLRSLPQAAKRQLDRAAARAEAVLTAALRASTEQQPPTDAARQVPSQRYGRSAS